MINLKEKLTAVADKFRSVLGTTDLIYPETFTDKIDEVYETGYSEAESDFWDNIQYNGKRKFYEYAFCYWDCEYIRPKYKVVPTSRAIAMFEGNISLKAVEKDYFDLSNCRVEDGAGVNGYYATFRDCDALEVVEDIGMPAGGYYQTFRGCKKLHTIEVLRFNEETRVNTPFTNCSALENITVEGTIGNDLTFQYSAKLSKESITSVITHLSDTVTDKTLTLSQTAVSSAFTDEEWAELEGTKTNWTIALV